MKATDVYDDMLRPLPDGTVPVWKLSFDRVREVGTNYCPIEWSAAVRGHDHAAEKGYGAASFMLGLDDVEAGAIVRAADAPLVLSLRRHAMLRRVRESQRRAEG